MTSAIELTDLCVRRSGKTIVDGVSFSVPQAHWFGVVGANGSGKTTLLRALSGRLAIASGHCALAGVNLATDRAARARRVGFAAPIERLPIHLRVRELLELAGDPLPDQESRNAALWSALGMAALLGRRTGELSSGMRQRVAIALAFVTETAIAVLDEPFNWLDPVAAFDTREALSDKVANGLTLVTALHDMTTLCSSCDTGILMAEGRLKLALGRDQLLDARGDPLKFEQEMIAALR